MKDSTVSKANNDNKKARDMQKKAVDRTCFFVYGAYFGAWKSLKQNRAKKEKSEITI